VADYLAVLERLYNASNFFPTDSSEAGQGLRAWAMAMDTALQAAGLGAILGDLPLSTGPVLSTEDINSAISADNGGLQMDPLQTVPGLWKLGDVEVGAWARLLHGDRRDSAGAPTSLRYLLVAGGLVRLGTGAVDDPAIAHDLGSGDGQTDVEGQVYGEILSARLGISSAFRYGVQLSTTLPRRIAPPDLALASASSLTEVEWTPGNYLELDVAPRFHLTPELAFAAWYGLRTKAGDRYRRLSPPPGPGLDERFPGPLHTDAALLEAETEETVHRMGLSLLYSSVDAWVEGRTGSPFQAYLSLGTAVAGSGGQTPQAFTARAGVRLFRRILGG
jgi:hypothetical protein